MESTGDTPIQGYTVSYDDWVEDEIAEITLEYQELKELKEQFVDRGFELPRIHPAEMKCLEYIRNYFITRKNEAIPFYDLKSVMYDCRGITGKNLGQFQIIQTLRRMWRAGLIRRFVKGRSKKGNSKKAYKGRGNWYGIHYLLYPREEQVK